MNALILAGGATPPELSGASASTLRALIEIGERPMLSYVLEALRGTNGLNRIAVTGADEVQQCARQTIPDAVAVDDTGKMMSNAVAGIQALRTATSSDEPVLIATCDIPLVTHATFEEFLRGFEQKKLEAAYAIVNREICLREFPEGHRTYAHLSDGHFTAGNAVIVQGHIIEKLAEVFEQFYQARKNPLAMARLLGGKFLWQALSKKLSVAGAEAKLSELTGCHAGAVQMQDATIAFDVDKLSDYETAALELKQRASAIV